MDLNSVLDRFTGRNFVLYGGDEELLRQVQTKGVVLYWYTNRFNETTNPPQQLYTRFIQNMDDVLRDPNSASPIRDAIIIVVGNGYVGSLKAEIFAPRILRAPAYTSKLIIFHGYPGFITMTENGDTVGGIVKQVYANGSIVAPEDDRIVYLQELTSVMLPSVNVPVPLRDQDLSVNSDFYRQVGGILPYIHMISRIRDVKQSTGSPSIPISDDLPIDILNLNDQQRQRDYDPNEWTSAVHWGQRKLLISEIELLVEVLREDFRRADEARQRGITSGDIITNAGRGFTLVYVGAAPGSHIPYLLSLFANITDLRIHLWDRPSRFDVQEDTSIPVDRRLIRVVPPEFADPAMTGDTEGFFTDVVARNYLQRYGTNNKLIFVSDIRDRASEEAVHRDMVLQRGWVETLQPYASQLKFRLPFSGDNTYEYLAGQVYTQAWSRIKSTEARLLSFRPFRSQLYNVNDYDRQMSYFNVITRMSSYDIGRTVDVAYRNYSRNRNTGTSGIGPYIPLPEEGYCTCHDCAREAQVIAKYMGYVGMPVDANRVSMVIRANTIASRPRDDRTNLRTLWSRVMPKAPPSDRRNTVLFRTLPENHQELERITNQLWIQRITEEGRLVSENNEVVFVDSPLDRMRVTNVSKLLVYGDGLSPQEIVDLLLAKTGNRPYIASPDSSIVIMRQVLTGSRPTIVVNFHSDFLRQYDPTRDRGVIGTSQYNNFRQGLAIRQQRKGVPPVDSHGQLLLFVLSNTTR